MNALFGGLLGKLLGGPDTSLAEVFGHDGLLLALGDARGKGRHVMRAKVVFVGKRECRAVVVKEQYSRCGG
jgi:hypothetical protein